MPIHRNTFRSAASSLLALFLASAVFVTIIPRPALAGVSGSETIQRNNLVFLSASDLAGMIRSGRVTSTEAVEAYLEQIAKHNASLNAIVTLDADGARKRAREADEALARGEVWGPLHGVPVTIKDNYAVSGMRTTNGLTALSGYVPDYDATTVERLKKAGAVILGKTNLPPLAMDVQTGNALFGITKNPWDPGRTTGGSSGGDAAAVAAGLTALGIGNDIGGSIRIPAHFCGIYGIKPTENVTSTFGVSPGMETGSIRSVRHLSCCGPLARSIEDLRLALSVIAGPDLSNAGVTPMVRGANKPVDLKHLHVTWTDDFGGVPVTEETRVALRAFTERLSDRGCVVERLSGSLFGPHLETMRDRWKDLYHVQDSDLPGVDFTAAWTTYGRLMDLELGVYQPSFFRFVSYVTGWWYRDGVPTISMVFPQTYERYLKTITRRDFYVSAMDEFLEGRDVLICPVTSTPAFEHIKPWRYFGNYPIYTDPVLVDGTPVKYLAANMSYTTIFNLTGNPVVVIPVGYTRSGLPIGVQLVGRRWHDMDLLAVAEALDKAAGSYRRPTGY